MMARRDVGRLLDSQRATSDKLRKSEPRATGSDQRTADSGQRPTDYDQQTTSGVMRVAQATSDARRSNEAMWPRPAPATKPGVSNEPMVPTAPNAPIANPLYPVRRHIGSPLD
jgi:hypothetical protein